MKLSFATVILPFLTGAIAVPDEQTVNGVQLHKLEVNGQVFYGEPVGFLPHQSYQY